MLFTIEANPQFSAILDRMGVRRSGAKKINQ